MSLRVDAFVQLVLGHDRAYVGPGLAEAHALDEEVGVHARVAVAPGTGAGGAAVVGRQRHHGRAAEGFELARQVVGAETGGYFRPEEIVRLESGHFERARDALGSAGHDLAQTPRAGA